MVITVEKKVAYSSAILVLLYTYFLGSLFVGGDQEIYRKVYDFSGRGEFIDAYRYYRSRILSDEIGHFLISWVASQFFEKDIFNALANSVLAYFSVRLFVKWGAHPFLAFAISVFGYYHLAMYVSAERLKYATIFFTIGALYFPRYRFSYWMFLASIVTHLQYIIILAMVISDRFTAVLFSVFVWLKVRVSDVIMIVMAIFLSVLLFLFFSDHIFSKISAYHKNFDLTEYLRIFLFFLGSFFYSRKKTQVFSSFAILFLMVGLVGGTRVNLFGYFAFLFFAFPVRKGLNLGVILTLLYFSFGWAQYAIWVINCGVNRPC